MILSVSLENWMSFRDQVSLSMVANRERQHVEKVPRIDKYHLRVLPAAAIYGGNASGKTNLFKALNFAKKLVVDGTKPGGLIPVDPFRLDSTGQTRPVRLSIELLVDEDIYEFSFAATGEAVLEEKLVRISSTSETVLYHRKDGKPDFDRSLAKDSFLQFAFNGTRDNQLFLTNSVSQNVENFKPIHDWFKNNLTLIAPDSRFEPFEQFMDEGSQLVSTMNEMLSRLDTGIARLGYEEIPFENLPLPSELRTRLQEDVNKGRSVRLRNDSIDERFVVTRKGDDLLGKRMVTYHLRMDGSEARFHMKQESDGSRRIIDLLPAFLDLWSPGSERVYVIDEIDRSLHPLLIRRLLELYLSDCSAESRAQVLFTTHNTQLMDQRLLRRDEMWVTERDEKGVSTLFSFSDYKDVRYDKDVRKSYLQGRLGGIPRIRLDDLLTCPRPD